jgi:phosphoribosyl 1,2-cyclic phosphate phosphodiesterase
MQIEAIFLGTGTSQGIPIIGCNCIVCNSSNFKDRRLRSSLLIIIDDFHILIDIGPDFRYQMLKAKINSINAILFSHQHRDHTAGLDDIRPVYYIKRQPIDLYAEPSVLTSLKSDFHYLFSNVNYPGKPQFNLNAISKNPFYVNNIEVKPIRAMHHKLPVLGFRIGDLAYITDANFISDIEKKKLFGLKILIINSLQREKHISHFSLDESLALIKELKPENSYLTHIGHGMGLHDVVNAELPSNIHLAYDNLKLYC